MIIALYNNYYSEELVKSYIGDRKKILINIGKTSSIEQNEFQKLYNNKQIYKLANLIRNRIDEIEELIVPNKNNLLTNVLIGICKNKKISQVTEGSLNYIRRPFSLVLIIKNIMKFFLAAQKRLVYNPFFLDPVDNISKNNGCLILRSEKIVNSTKKEFQLKIERDPIRLRTNRNVIIIGQEFDKFEKIPNDAKNSFSRLIKLTNIKNYKFYYLKHPKSLDEGSDFKLYKDLDPTIIEGIHFLNLLNNVKPEYVIAFGGSSTFMELNECSCNVKKIAFGFDALIKKGFKRYMLLKNFYYELDQTIIVD